MANELEKIEAEVLEGIKPFDGVLVKADSVPEQVLMNGGVLQQIRTGYTTAVSVQKPRSITKIANSVIEEARLAGKSFYYRWTTKNKDGSNSVIQGPSIDLAMAMCRHYGNCAVDVEVSETPSHYLMKGVFIDLESGFTCTRLFRQRKGQNFGMKDKERAEDIVFQIGQSKAIRNAIIKAMPEWLIEKAIEVAMDAEALKASKEITSEQQKVIKYFRQYGISAERIEAERGRPVDQWTPDDIVELRGMATALKEGRTSAEELFPPVQPTSEPKSHPKQAGEQVRKPAHVKTQPDEHPQPVAKGGQVADPALSKEEAKALKNLAVAMDDFPTEYMRAVQELGLRTGKHTPEQAIAIMQKINQYLDEA